MGTRPKIPHGRTKTWSTLHADLSKFTFLTGELNILHLDNGAQRTYCVVSMATLNTLYIVDSYM
jgi:hypothetical protein